MLKHDKNGGTITFRLFIGSGEYKGLPFDLCVTTTPAGNVTGLPIIDFKDENRTSVTFELEELVVRAYEFAFGETAD